MGNPWDSFLRDGPGMGWGAVPHHQCQDCDVMTAGPHTDKNPGRQINYADLEPTEEGGRFYDWDEAEAAGKADVQKYGVSHGYCDTCGQKRIDEHRQQVEARKLEAARAELEERMRRKREQQPPAEPAG